MTIPTFTYHADPLRTGVMEPSDAACSCCGQRRGYVYCGPVRLGDGGSEPNEICPWCIADDSAAAKFRLEFVRPRCLTASDLPADVVAEVTRRTPGYSAWQEPKWQCCCGDACVFHGDLSKEEAQNPDWNAVAALLGETVAAAKESWPDLASNYEIADPSIFKFICRHCGKVFYQVDSA